MVTVMGGRALLHRYIIRHAAPEGLEGPEGGPAPDMELVAHSGGERDILAAGLDARGVEYTVEALDVEGMEWVEGPSFGSCGEAMAALAEGEAAHMAARAGAGAELGRLLDIVLGVEGDG